MKTKRETGCLLEMSHGGTYHANCSLVYIFPLLRSLFIFLSNYRMFLSSVRRLRIMRTSEANGLGMYYVEEAYKKNLCLVFRFLIHVSHLLQLQDSVKGMKGREERLFSITAIRKLCSTKTEKKKSTV